MKLIIAAVALGTVSASPAFAQMFDPGAGTGNSLPMVYDALGGKHRPVYGYYGPLAPPISPPSDQPAAAESGLYAFARVPRVHSKYAPAAIIGYSRDGTVTEIFETD